MDFPKDNKQAYQKYKAVRNRTEEICRPLALEDYGLQRVEFVSPPKWHLGHTSWFFEQFILIPYWPDYTEYHPDFHNFFNSYYNALDREGKRVPRNKRGLLSRPSVEEVYKYRAYVDSYMERLLESEKLSSKCLETIFLGWNHEEQHQELLLMDIKYNLGHHSTSPAYGEQSNALLQEWADIERATHGEGKTGPISIEEGIYSIGYKNERGFCYDNERGYHSVYLAPYTIESNVVTNGEFLEFMRAGGYQQFSLWLDEGWSWLQNGVEEIGDSVKTPMYWKEISGEWYCYTWEGLKPLNLQQPVTHVSFYEANAYAEWKGMRLPTEFEWEVASQKLPWGEVWEWTYSAYLPYPGFKKSSGVVGEYNGKFMIHQMVLRGGSMFTPKGHSRPTYRNFFHPHERWQFSGIRLAHSVS